MAINNAFYVTAYGEQNQCRSFIVVADSKDKAEERVRQSCPVPTAITRMEVEQYIPLAADKHTITILFS